MNVETAEQKAVKQVIEEAYIEGIHGNQDEKKVKSGFHQDFLMLVSHENILDKVTVDQWLLRIETGKADNPELWMAKTTCTYEVIDVTGNAAAVKLNVYKGKKQFSTDYMLLYKLKDGWRIVSKIFSLPL